MSTYKLIQTNGRGIRYLKDKKFIKKADIPADILAKIEMGKDTPDEAENLNPDNKRCLFCGMGGCKYNRLISAQIVYLCDNHFYSENMGKIAQKVRELEGVTNG